MERIPITLQNGVTDVLDRPLSQEWPVRDLTRLACVAKDGTPRNVPIRRSSMASRTSSSR